MTKISASRGAILDLHSKGHAQIEISRRLKVSRQLVSLAIKRETLEDRPRSGRKVTVTTPRLKKIVKKRIDRNPRKSIRKLAKELKTSVTSMHRLVRDKLKLIPYKLQKKQALSDAQTIKRLARCKGLLARAVRREHLTTLFTEEKLFTIEQSHNTQNDRVLAKSSGDADSIGRTVLRSSHPQSMMVFAGVTADSRTELFFVEKEVKIDGDYYLDKILKKNVMQWAQKTHNNQNWTFMQDGAPAHTKKKVQDWCMANFPSVISKDEWPPNSPDLNVMDFSIWGMLETNACFRKHTSLGELKKALIKSWKEIPQDDIRAAVESYPERLRAVIKAKGGHIE